MLLCDLSQVLSQVFCVVAILVHYLVLREKYQRCFSLADILNLAKNSSKNIKKCENSPKEFVGKFLKIFLKNPLKILVSEVGVG